MFIFSTHLQHLKSRCDFPTYVPHYQFQFRNRWYHSFLENSGGKLEMCVKDFVPYDGSLFLRLDRSKKRIVETPITKNNKYPYKRSTVHSDVYWHHHKMVLLLFGGTNNSETVQHIIYGDHIDRDKRIVKLGTCNI